MSTDRRIVPLTDEGNGYLESDDVDDDVNCTFTLGAHDDVAFPVKPKSYYIKGTPMNSKIIFLDVDILDSTGRMPFRGDVYIEGERIKYVGSVPNVQNILNDPIVKVFQGRGRTLMSGMGDAHTHMTWAERGLSALGDLSVEEHTLITARSAKLYLDSGYTMCFGAASAKERIDSTIRDAINDGHIPGPRYLANGREMARRDGELEASITAFADGPMEMREVIRHHVDIGVDAVKLSMSGEEFCVDRPAEKCYFTDEETAACVDEAHRHGKMVCAHARARDSVKMCVKHGVDLIYHASFTDNEGMCMLEKARSRVMVAPALGALYAGLYEGEAVGMTYEMGEALGYKRELDASIKVLKEMRQRRITILPGGDYGFPWTPHGTYARELDYFVKLLDFTPMESIMAATAGVAKLFSREHELGKIQPGFYADCVLVNGSPLQDIGILQNHEKLSVIMINGRVHKNSDEGSLPLNTAPQIISFPDIADKIINVEKVGNGPDTIVCVHGLGGSIDCWRPLIRAASLAETHTVLLYDIEGHGLTPVANNVSPTVETYADDLLAVLQANGIDSATIIAHSLGCMIAAVFALKNPMRVKKLVLLSPLPLPVMSQTGSGLLQRAALVRRNGMKSIVDEVAEAGVSERSRQHRPVSISAIRFGLLGCNPVGYSKLCVAAAHSVESTWSYTKLPMTTLLIAGAEDVPSSQLLQSVKKDMQNATVNVAEGCGHWLVYEDEPTIAQTIKDFIRQV